jgi:hypothetical protein
MLGCHAVLADDERAEVLVDDRDHGIAVARDAEAKRAVVSGDQAPHGGQIGPPGRAQPLVAGKARHRSGDFGGVRPGRPPPWRRRAATRHVALDRERAYFLDFHASRTWPTGSGILF